MGDRTPGPAPAPTFVRDLANFDDGRDGGAGLDLEEWTRGLGLLAWDDRTSVWVPLTEAQAAELEVALYRYRIARTFNNRKEPDADGEPGPGPELEGRTPTPPHP